MKIQKLSIAFLICISSLFATSIKAQVTTSTIQGIVKDSKGEPLAGATVVAVHTPSGTQYGTSARSDGRYNLPNLRIGGPYEVTASFIGFESKKIQEVFLTLGKTQVIDIILDENVQGLEEVVVTVNRDINAGRTGAATTIDNAQLNKIPTITRSAGDIYKLSPSSDGNSFGGRNDQYNNFSLDGSIFNNPFGLDAATPGGQSNAQPVSLDAIDQIQVSIAPYDVTQSGFTGASVNAVTKSGNNSFQGTAFSFYRNQDLTGSTVSGNNIFVPDLAQLQSGFSIGGPIVEDKLFFFANFEIERREDLGSNFRAAGPGISGDNVSRVLASDLQAVSNILESRFGYSTGSFERYNRDTDSNKGLFKLDWNINNSNTLTATFNFLDAYRDLNANPDAIGRRGPDAITLQYANSGYRINNDITSYIVELKSRFGNKYSNKLQAGYTFFNDKRDPFSEAFPVVNINKDGVRYIVAGHEPFSINNSLDQHVYQLTNNFDIYLGAHTVTLGLSLERFSFDNSFNLGVYEPFGVPYPGGTFGPGFDNVQDFLDFVNNGDMDPIVQYARDTFDAGNWGLAETNVGQFALYAQDKWSVSDDFNLTLGIRMDLPLYFDTADKIRENIARKGGLFSDGGSYDPTITYYDENNNPVQFDHTDLPDQKPLFSPRLGFNWDVVGDQSVQLRGGTGLFTGRFPFVWVGNQVANPDFFFYNITSPDFEYPQVWRTNIGIDKAFDDGLVLSTDISYTKDVNSMLVRNFGLRVPTSNLVGADNRAYYLNNQSDKALDPFGNPGQNAYVYTNTNEGYSFNWSVEAKKVWEKGLYTSLAYNFLDAQTVSSNTREISSDIFEGNPILNNANKPKLSPGVYGNRHRIIGSANKTWIYGTENKWSTTVSVFMETSQGGRFSYTYSGDINNDGSGLNDLIYIPTELELATYLFSGGVAQQLSQRQAFNNFIEQDDYLRERRGQYAERYAILSPWSSRIDIRVLQNLNLLNTQSIQLSMDLLNLGNLLNSEWGVKKIPVNTQPIGVTVDSNTRIPTYSFDDSQSSTFVDDFNLGSRWQIQFGLRYNF